MTRSAPVRESTIGAAVREAVNTARDSAGNFRARIVRNNSGVEFVRDEAGKIIRVIRYGLGRGSADYPGMLRGGRAFAIETKAGKRGLSDDQRAWWQAFRAWGGLGGVARSVAEAMALLDEAERIAGGIK